MLDRASHEANKALTISNGIRQRELGIMHRVVFGNRGNAFCQYDKWSGRNARAPHIIPIGRIANMQTIAHTMSYNRILSINVIHKRVTHIMIDDLTTIYYMLNIMNNIFLMLIVYS